MLGRHTYVTQSSYLELLASFKTLISQKQDSTMKAKKRYLIGLEKLAFASSQVCHFILAPVGRPHTSARAHIWTICNT